jgi:hypothetical protein
MNRKTDNELLDDVLAEAAPADFREALLGESLRVVRRRRRFRQTRNAASIVVVILALLGIAVWQKHPKTPSLVSTPPMKKTVPAGYTLITTQPLPADAIITTRPLAAAQFTTSPMTVAVVQTSTGNYRLIDDDQLLALLAAHPAVLVRTGPHSEELVFANPQDAKGSN